MRGGVVSKEDQSELLKDQIDRLLEESDFEFLQRGTFGFVFKVTYTGERSSGFIDFETKKSERVFIMKVQAMDFEMSLKNSDNTGLPPNSKRIDWGRLRDEVDLQKNLFETALEKNIRPPCPAILDFRSITLTQLDSFVKKNKNPDKQTDLIYKDGGEAIPPEEYDDYNAGIILMEFVPAFDITTIMQKQLETFYIPRFKEIRNKVFRLYCTALQCGIDQVDVNPPNYLFGEDGTVTMIDFGIARIVEDPTIDELIDRAEKGEYEPLKDYLREHNHRFDQWLLNNEKGHGTVVFDPLKPLTLPDGLAKQCQDGICQIEYQVKKTRTQQQIDKTRRRRQTEKDALEAPARQREKIMEKIKEIEERKVRKERELKAESPSFWNRMNPFSNVDFEPSFSRGGTKRRRKGRTKKL
uniref:Protein kinase domain-containing protein n=1 Tax=viral metagenome TaxID=1070528 RepID=A0A6C0HYX2_9ZZZZ